MGLRASAATNTIFAGFSFCVENVDFQARLLSYSCFRLQLKASRGAGFRASDDLQQGR